MEPRRWLNGIILGVEADWDMELVCGFSICVNSLVVR
ncbi:hypothetical protein PEDI_31330 [Persicobacter diffluens]|uniref:Uncharacterized protein n=1 Tax=Persicobacter diffluens TaxID=981 RepID=A0AAN4W0Q2_9BACT|nr:hypothetical protein PEDI_31330 [Persicobacter diffluens]